MENYRGHAEIPRFAGFKAPVVVAVVAAAVLLGVVAALCTTHTMPRQALFAQATINRPAVAPARVAAVHALPNLDLEDETPEIVTAKPNPLPAAAAALGAAVPLAATATPLEGLGAEGTPLNSYIKFWIPLVDGALGGNDALIHWLHPVNMGIVLLAMGGYGTYLGFDIRRARLEGTPRTEALAGASHPALMGLMTVLFALGGQGGLLFTLYEGRPLFSSEHSVTGVAGITLLLAQGVLGKVMKVQNSDTLRTAHTVIGSAIMILLLIHAGLGLKLGLSS
uniref:Uncharacterized protein n=1 Tax=Eutreptiella gymnastica TaxID=73025 RepID=A0A7S4GID7_9EUGL